MFAHPVFGPDRPNAARAALFELEQAEIAYHEAGGGLASNQGTWLRVLEAKRNRNEYPEYGDGPEPCEVCGVDLLDG